MTEPVLELLGTRGCHLCEEAEAVVGQAAAIRGVLWQYLDIADDADLLARYAERIPVLRMSGGEEIRWPFSLLDVLRLLRTRDEPGSG